MPYPQPLETMTRMSMRVTKPQTPEEMLLRVIRVAEILMKAERKEVPVRSPNAMPSQEEWVETCSRGRKKHKQDVLM